MSMDWSPALVAAVKVSSDTTCRFDQSDMIDINAMMTSDTVLARTSNTQNSAIELMMVIYSVGAGAGATGSVIFQPL